MKHMIHHHLSTDVILPLYTLIGSFFGALAGGFIGLAYDHFLLCAPAGAFAGLIVGFILGVLKIRSI